MRAVFLGRGGGIFSSQVRPAPFGWDGTTTCGVWFLFFVLFFLFISFGILRQAGELCDDLWKDDYLMVDKSVPYLLRQSRGKRWLIYIKKKSDGILGISDKEMAYGIF